jgi:uncharacterized protein
MNDFLQRYGEWALVAGAADGIGAAFSESLARKGMNLIMVDRNDDLMADLAMKLESTYGIKVTRHCQNLSEQDAWKNCMSAILPYDCRLLVYVPAYSPVRPFLQNTEADLDLFLDLNCRTLVLLVHAFATNIRNEKPGGILLISSLAGLIGPKFSATYAGTKAFSIILAESLNAEFKEKDIDVTVCCAGITDTPTYWSSFPDNNAGSTGIMKSMDVATIALKHLGKKAICIPGWKDRLIFFFLTRLLPRKMAVRLVNRSMVKMYGGRMNK